MIPGPSDVELANLGTGETRSVRQIALRVPIVARQGEMVDQTQCKLLTQSMTRFPSRRDVVRGLAGTGLGLGTLTMLGFAEATNTRRKKHKGKKKSRSLVFNRFGCVDAGQPCRGDGNNCCSGICEGVAPRKGKPDQSRCVPHNAGVCTLETNPCDIGVEVPCDPNNRLSSCTVTTGNAAFCADISAGTTTHCRVCSRDTDCQGEFGAAAACVVLGGECTPLCVATGRTACLPAGI